MNVDGDDIDEIFDKAEDRTGRILDDGEDSGNYHAIMLILATLEWYEETYVESDTNK